MSSARVLAVCLAGGMSVATAADALTSNPIDPGLPLDQHASTLCIGASDASTGGIQTSCSGSHVVENPATLSGVVGTGAGSADLRTGSLHSRSTAQALWFGADQLRAGGFSSVKLYDTITIEGGFTGTIELRMAIDGSFFTTDASPNVMGSEMVAGLLGVDGAGFFVANAGVDVIQFNSGEVGLWNWGTNGPATLTTNAGGSQNLFDPADVQVVFSLFFQVTPSNPTFSFVARLDTYSALGFTNPVNQVTEAETNFGNTAQLAVLAPAGVIWTSASGAFLVPEPASLVLLATACAALGLRARHARRELDA